MRAYETVRQANRAARIKANIGIQAGDVDQAAREVIETSGFGKYFTHRTGHGLGLEVHEEPYIKPGNDFILEKGMTFTIEPMINAGKYDIKVLDDGWTAVTKDKSLSAQFEHTIGITENGYEIFTESAKGYSKPPYL